MLNAIALAALLFAPGARLAAEGPLVPWGTRLLLRAEFTTQEGSGEATLSASSQGSAEAPREAAASVGAGASSAARADGPQAAQAVTPPAEALPEPAAQIVTPLAPGSEPAPPVGWPGLSPAERQARLVERAELEAARPRGWTPLILTASGLVLALGGGGLVWSAVVTAIWYAFSFAVGSVVLLTSGIILFAVAVPLTIIGAVKLHRARVERRRIELRLEQLNQEEAGVPTVMTF